MSRRWWIGTGLGRADRPDPAHQRLTCWADARPGPSNFNLVGRGPARPANFSEDGPRPGPAHQSFRRWAAARASLSHFQFLTARPVTIFRSARLMRHGLYMDRPDNYVGRPVDLTGRPMGRLICRPVLKGACEYTDVT